MPTVSFAFVSHIETERPPKTNMRIPIFPESSSDQAAAEITADNRVQRIYTVAGRADEVASPSIIVDHPVDPFTSSRKAYQKGVYTVATGF